MEDDLDKCLKGNFDDYKMFSQKERKDFRNFDPSKFKNNKEDFKSF